ncbi:ABC transporter permease, partial [Planococcus sp. SIMBA_160]
FLTQYARYVGNAFQGDFGYSSQTTQPVADVIMVRVPNTLKLAVASMIVAVIFGILTGLICALRQDSWLDVSATTFALAG